MLAVSGVGDGLPEGTAPPVLGGDMLVSTKSDVLKPEIQFRHVAVTFEDKSSFIFAKTKCPRPVDRKELGYRVLHPTSCRIST